MSENLAPVDSNGTVQAAWVLKVLALDLAAVKAARQQEAARAFNQKLQGVADLLELMSGIAPSSAKAETAQAELQTAMTEIGVAQRAEKFAAASEALDNAVAAAEIVSSERIAAREAFFAAYAPLTDRLEACQAKAPALFGLDPALAEAANVAESIGALSNGPDFRPAQQALPTLRAAIETLEQAVAATEHVRDRHNALYPRITLARDLSVIEGAAVKQTRDDVARTDDAVMAAWTRGDFPGAEKALDEVGPALDALDLAKKQALESQIKILAGWPQASGEAGRLTGELNKLGTPLIADPGFAKVAADVKTAIDGWRTVRAHNYLVASLVKTHGCLASIPGESDTPDPYATERNDYKDALAKTPNPATTIVDCDKLAGLRATLADAAKALMAAHEKTAADDDEYWMQKAQDLLASSAVLRDRAGAVTPTTPAMGKLKQEVDLLIDKSSLMALIENDEYKAAALQIEKGIAKAEELLAARASPKDPAETGFYAEYRKVEATIASAAKIVDDTDPTKQAIAMFTPVHTEFMKKLAGSDGDRFTWCSAHLADLVNKANAVLDAKTQALRNGVGVAKGKGSAGEKASAALALTQGADDAILARLGASEHLDLLEALRAEGMPAFDEDDENTRSDPKRTAMRKIYGAMSLDTEFVKKDEERRKVMIEALAAKKDELKAARENWHAFSDDQKKATLTSLAEAQCEAFGFPMPTGGITIFNDPTDDDMGSYAPGSFAVDPPQDGIKINGGQAALHDFETALDTIFHENSHKYQNYLVRRLRLPTGNPDKLLPAEDPPYTQARMFEMGNVGGGYVKNTEDPKVYAKQPEEDHAWSAGPKSAQMLLDVLNAP